MASREQQIQAAVLGILEDAAADLRIDARGVKLLGLFPDKVFQQRAFPAIIVERPRETGVEPHSNITDRITYEADVWCLDAYRPTAEGEVAGRERLSLLAEKLDAALWGEPYLRLEVFAVMPGFWEFGQSGDEPTQSGNNIMRLKCRLVVPLIVQKRGA